MPLVDVQYAPPLPFRNAHISTIYAGLFRTVNGVVYERERLELKDGDFLDLDWSSGAGESKRVVILLHGLEGNSGRPYITGSARSFNARGYDVCALNFRGCSGEVNRLYSSYHSGATEDLETVITHILTKKYTEIYLKGFSLGGNIALKYLGEGRYIPSEVKAAIGVSVPCDLHSSLRALLHPKNHLYARRFRNHLLKKLQLKLPLFPDQITAGDIKKIRNLQDFDELYTSRAHGFLNALDYYARSSSLQFLEGIRLPTLIINASDDTFLGPECYPVLQAERNPQLFLEMPRFGGHVDFYGLGGQTYSEKRAINFLEEQY